MPDYKMNDPRGWGGDPKRGAALGRPVILDAPRGYRGNLYVTRIHLTDGYDENGTYFGEGPPLYWCANEECTIDYARRGANALAATLDATLACPAVVIMEPAQLLYDHMAKKYLEDRSWSPPETPPRLRGRDGGLSSEFNEWPAQVQRRYGRLTGYLLAGHPHGVGWERWLRGLAAAHRLAPWDRQQQ